MQLVIYRMFRNIIFNYLLLTTFGILIMDTISSSSLLLIFSNITGKILLIKMHDVNLLFCKPSDKVVLFIKICYH